MASTIPTHSTNDYLSSTDWNTLPTLNTQGGLYGVGACLVGTAPSTSAPNFLTQTGRINQNADVNSHLLLTFPNAFPNGLVSVQVTPGLGYGMWVDTTVSISASFCYIKVYTLSTGAGVGASGPYIAIWTAVGF